MTVNLSMEFCLLNTEITVNLLLQGDSGGPLVVQNGGKMELWGKWLIFINIMKINPEFCDVQSIISVQLSARLDYAFICSTPCKLSPSLTQILYTVKRRLVYRKAHLVFLSFGIYTSNLTLILKTQSYLYSKTLIVRRDLLKPPQ